MIAALTLVVIATVPPQPRALVGGQRFFTSLLPMSPNAWFDILQNVALFVPVGLMALARGSRLGPTAWVTVGLSTSIELLQLTIAGRESTAMDIVANTAGACVGWGLANRVGRERTVRLLSRTSGAIRYAFAADGVAAKLNPLVCAGAAAAVLGATGFLLSPALDSVFLVPGREFEPPSGPIRVGSNGRQRSFGGAIDDLRIYAEARAPSAIRADMHRPVARGESQGALVGAYGFDEPDASVARDSSGNERDGIASATTWTRDGKFGGAVAFTSVDSEIRLPQRDAFRLRDRMTIEAWVRLDPTDDPGPSMIVDGGGAYFLAAAFHARRWAPAGGGVFAQIDEHVDLNDPIPPGAWTHLAATWDGEVFRMYRDGTPDAYERWWSPHRASRIVLSGRPLRFDAALDGRAVAASLRSSINLNMRLTCGSLVDDSLPVFRIVGLRSVDALAILAEGDDLLVRWSTRPRKWGLASPPHYFPNALEHCSPGRVVALEMIGSLTNPVLRLDGQRLDGDSPDLASGWAFIIHSELLPVSVNRALSLAWLAALVLPFGLSVRRNVWSALAAAVLAVPILLGHRWFDVESLDSSQLAVIVAALAVSPWIRPSRT